MHRQETACAFLCTNYEIKEPFRVKKSAYLLLCGICNRTKE